MSLSLSYLYVFIILRSEQIVALQYGTSANGLQGKLPNAQPCSKVQPALDYLNLGALFDSFL